MTVHRPGRLRLRLAAEALPEPDRPVALVEIVERLGGWRRRRFVAAVAGTEECFLDIAEHGGIAVDLGRVGEDLGDRLLMHRRCRIRRRRSGWLVEHAADRRVSDREVGDQRSMARCGGPRSAGAGAAS